MSNQIRTKVKDIAKAIEDFAPLRLKESWDNPGLQVGDPEMEVSAVLLCLDVTEEILQEAKKRDCNMIVSHHPLIFGGLKRLTGATCVERIAADALRSDIAIYSAHTNLDSAFEGDALHHSRSGFCLHNYFHSFRIMNAHNVFFGSPQGMVKS